MALISEVIINDRAAATLAKIEAGFDKVTVAEAKTTRATDTASRQFEQLARAADPAYGALARLADQQAKLQRAVDLGARSQADANAVYAGLQRQADLTVQRLGGMSAAANENTAAFSLNRNGLLQLQAAGVNAFQALASGMSPLRVATTEGAQALGAFAQGGLGFSGILRGLVSPVGLVATAIVGLGGGIGLLALRAGETEARLRTFDVILRGTGASSNVTALGLDAVVRQLRATGTAAAEANAAVQAFSRVPGINPGAASTLVPLARDIGTVRGEDLASVATKMATAFATSTEAAVKLVYELAGPNGLTEAEVKNMTAMAAHGDRAGALKVAIDALQRQMGGSFENSLSAGAKAVNSIGAAWDNMLTSLSNTRGVQAARDAVIGMLNGISGAVTAKTTDAGIDAYQQRLALGRRQAGFLAPQVGVPSGVNYGAGGALSRIAASNVDLGNLNAEFARRLQLWFDDLSDADKALVTITSGARTVKEQADIYARGGIAAAPGGSGHNYGTAEQIKANDAAQRTKDIQDRINERTDQIAVLQLQAGLQGQTPEMIAAATAHLQEQQRLLALSEPLTSDIAKASLANVDALSRANIQLSAATRESQRWDDAVRGVVSTIESSLTGAIEAAFSGQKVDDWGKRIKSMLASLIAQISDALFIKPLLGQPLGLLGWGQFPAEG